MFGKLGGFLYGENVYGFQNKDGRDGKGFKWFLREPKVFRGIRPLFKMRRGLKIGRII